MDLNTEGVPTHRFDMKRPSGADSQGRSNFVNSERQPISQAPAAVENANQSAGEYSEIAESVPKTGTNE